LFIPLVASGQVLNESAKLIASDGELDDSFGAAVAISGTFAVVGAASEDANGDDSGAAYVYRWNGVSWIQQKLLPSDGSTGDVFGFSVSISGDAIVSGAYVANSTRGSAYVFRFNGTSWVQQQKLVPTGGALPIATEFGNSVSVSGDVAVVGAHRGWEPDFETGAAYVFRWNGSTWAQQQKLLASDRALGDYFGESVGVSGDVIVVGAWTDDDNGTNSGSAYVFRWNGSSWVQQQKLLASDGAAFDRFGNSVSASGDWVVVGAKDDADNGASSGSAYVFRWNPGAPGSWVEEPKLLPSDGAIGDSFGGTVSVSGDVIIVGAPGDDEIDAGTGSAYVFRWNGSSWVEDQKLLASDADGGDGLASSVAVDGGLAVAGAAYGDGNVSESGAAYVFQVECDSGYYGPTCLECPGSASNPCNGNGSCDDGMSGSGSCTCDEGFLGPECSVMIPAVSSWGMIVLLLLFATAGAIVLASRRDNVPSRGAGC
jgi:hypothetical protein